MPSGIDPAGAGAGRGLDGGAGRRHNRGMSSAERAERELAELFEELEALLKNPELACALADRAVNASLFLVAVQGLRAYARGEKASAAEDLGTVAEEIRERLRALEAAAKDVC